MEQNLKGTRTEKNLLAAFSGESVARAKYLFFADKAKAEGHPEVAELFEKMARNEGVHSRLIYEKAREIGNSTANLREAIEGEYGEWTRLYPDFAKTAREEGFEDIGALFDKIAKIERDHEFRFLDALAKLQQGSRQTVSQAETVQVPGWRCMFCGATYETRPDVCGVCEAIGSFEETTIQKQVNS